MNGDPQKSPLNNRSDLTNLPPDKASRAPKRWAMRYKILMAIIVCAAMITGYVWLMGPNVNSNPVRKVTIRGQFPYSEGYELVLQPSFYSHNPTCKQTARLLVIIPVADVHREARLPVRVTQDGVDRYTAEFYLDHFSEGFCDWKYGGMSYRFLGGAQTSTIGVALGPAPSQQNRMELLCRLKVPEPTRQYVSCQNSSPPSLDPKLGSSAEINFVMRKE